jgi:uncharacterized protein YdeI (YjbR/CyaY-like superfamily)
MQPDHVVSFATPEEWQSWLAANHASERDIWLKIAKRRVTGLHIEDALDVALCHGWIDSHRQGLDATHFLQRYSPRQRKSPWSRINALRVGELAAMGRMRAGGHAEIAAARADGRWPSDLLELAIIA